MNNSLLKLCPYCNSSAEYREETEYSSSRIICKQCHLNIKEYKATFNELAEIWNKLPRNESDKEIYQLKLENTSLKRLTNMMNESIQEKCSDCIFERIMNGKYFGMEELASKQCPL